MRHKLAIHGGAPVRSALLPYGRQWVDEEDIQAVTDVLRSDWLTTGPKVHEFEAAFATFVEAKEAVAISNGTAALHAAIYAIGLQPGDEVIVTPMTFAASANCVVYQGGAPIFADVEPDTLLIDPAQVEAKITPRTKAIVAVDYAGHPCNYEQLREIAAKHNLYLIDDACHAVGGAYRGQSVGTLADLNTFSLHPVKHFTTGEGGAITTNDERLAARMRVFRNHGITTDHRQREAQGSWFYEMVDLGYNYRLTDIQCALGLSQIKKLPQWVQRRQEIAQCYDAAFSEIAAIEPLVKRADVSHAYHLYVIRVNTAALTGGRSEIFQALRAENIGVNVHYVPVHLHPFYQKRYGTHSGMCPVAESAYEQMITLPVFPRMSEEDIDDVIEAVHKVVNWYAA
ncbi:MAG: UDP-4-amino-4,6-dideoxy-N-acetyl-beta-L-altrosamine transaminase [Caldilineaceae bacterium]